MATLFNLIGANFDARLAAHASSIEAGDKARSEFRNQATEEFNADVKAFVTTRESVRSAANSANEDAAAAATTSFTATRDAIINFSEDGIVNTINDFVAELEANKIAINSLIADHTAAHEEAIANILAELGTEADFGTGYGDELPAYSADLY